MLSSIGYLHQQKHVAVTRYFTHSQTLLGIEIGMSKNSKATTFP